MGDPQTWSTTRPWAIRQTPATDMSLLQQENTDETSELADVLPKKAWGPRGTNLIGLRRRAGGVK